MANKLYDESAVSAIATAIRGKNGLTTQYKIADMAAAIAAIPSGGKIYTGTTTVSSDLITIYFDLPDDVVPDDVIGASVYSPSLDETPVNTCIIGMIAMFATKTFPNTISVVSYTGAYTTGNGNTTKTYAGSYTHRGNFDGGKFKFTHGNRYFKAGVTYNWKLFVL